MGNNAGAPLIPTREVKNQLRELWGTAPAMAIQQSKYFPCDFKAAFFKFMKSGKIGVNRRDTLMQVLPKNIVPRYESAEISRKLKVNALSTFWLRD